MPDPVYVCPFISWWKAIPPFPPRLTRIEEIKGALANDPSNYTAHYENETVTEYTGTGQNVNVVQTYTEHTDPDTQITTRTVMDALITVPNTTVVPEFQQVYCLKETCAIYDADGKQCSLKTATSKEKQPSITPLLMEVSSGEDLNKDGHIYGKTFQFTNPPPMMDGIEETRGFNLSAPKVTLESFLDGTYLQILAGG